MRAGKAMPQAAHRETACVLRTVVGALKRAHRVACIVEVAIKRLRSWCSIYGGKIYKESLTFYFY